MLRLIGILPCEFQKRSFDIKNQNLRRICRSSWKLVAKWKDRRQEDRLGDYGREINNDNKELQVLSRITRVQMLPSSLQVSEIRDCDAV